MKLKDFSEDEELNSLRRSMGAQLRKFEPHLNFERLTVDELERLAQEGLETPLDEVEVLPDGTLAYKGKRVVLYIRDVKTYRNGSPTEIDLPKFHISNCDTLQGMRANNRFERYVVATRETGEFRINLKTGNSSKFIRSDRRLRVCQNCLAKMDWDDYSTKRYDNVSRNKIVAQFSLAAFFNVFGKTFIPEQPKYDEDYAPLNDYTNDHKEMADREKAKRKYRCDQCSKDLSVNRKFLDAHHDNAQQYDNRPENIKILCVLCHANQFNHGHIKSTPRYKKFAELVRRGIIR
jgi:hypothetical protein